MIDHNNLEEFSDPVNYDREDTSDTGIAFYTALAQETGSPVLEIACGTGRVSIPIAQSGFAVTGLDIVPGMLERARNKAVDLPTRWIEGDARTFDLGKQFRLIFLTGNAFQAFLTNADQAALLQLALRYTFPQELAALLDYNGFRIIRQYGDWNLEPLSAASRSIIVVCRQCAQRRNC